MKEGNTRRKAGSRIVVGGGLLITAAVIALFIPRFGILDLREVVVLGNRATSAAEIVSASQLERGQSLLTLPIRRVRDQISMLPWIKSVSVRRSPPHTLRISVEERTPIAVIPAGDVCLVLGEGGVIVSTQCSLSVGLIELTGAEVSAQAAGGRVLNPGLLDLTERVAGMTFRGLTVRRIDAADPKAIRLETEQGVLVLLGDVDAAAERLVALAALCRRFDMGDYETIDLRFGGEAVLAPRKAVKR